MQMTGGQGRMTRVWLLALLVLTGAIAVGVLLVKFQLERLRASVHAEIEERTGVLLNVENLQVNGLTGLRLDKLHVLVKTDTGPSIEVHVPQAFMLISLIELVQGNIVLDRLQLDQAHIRLSRPPENTWLSSELSNRPGMDTNIPFRIVGEDCTLEVEGVVGQSALSIGDLDFDLNRLSDSPHIIANVSGSLDKDATQDFTLFARFATLEDFDVRVQSDGLTAKDVAVFFPEAASFLSAGNAQPNIRVSGYPRNAMVVSLELPFSNVALANAPDFPVPAEGTLTALASYDTASRLLTLNSAKTTAPEFEGRVEGTIALNSPLPVFDLRLEVQQLPVSDIAGFVNGKWLQDYGDLAVEAPEPYKFFVTLQGNAESARLGVEAQMANGSLTFEPKAANLPAADLRFSLMSVSWDSAGGFPTGNLALSGGTIRHAPTKLAAENVSGTLKLDGGGLALEPLMAQIDGNTITGAVHYTLENQSLDFNVSGNLGAAENLAFVKNNPQLALFGPIAIDALSGTVSPAKTVLDGTIDMTRTSFDWEWWFSKAPGIGARLENLHLDLRSKKSATMTFTASLDTTTIDTEVKMAYQGGKWTATEATARSDNVTMGTANKVLNIPYVISGGTGTGAAMKWSRKSAAPEVIEMTIGGHVDDLNLLPAGSRQPITGKDVRVDTVILKEGDDRTGTLSVHVATAALPPFGSAWLLPLRAPDDPSIALFPPLDRVWTYNLSADNLNYPPWHGEAFSAAAFTRSTRNGFDSFEATVDGGKVGGMYVSNQPENVSQLDAHWESVPAHYLLNHLKLPEVFTGTMTGGIKYELDRDDRGTLRGNGYFDVVDGQFSADYLFSQFERQIEAQTITLPPSLKFSRFSADVNLEGDTIRTENMVLESEALQITGEGQFVIDGDIDYHLRLELPPATAKGIPALRTYFNLDGMKHSQSNLKLAFHIFGARNSPKMELDGMPSVGDTILSGAVEVTTDVMKVVDLPRQILLDLFKIGGGIVGAGGKKSPEE